MDPDPDPYPDPYWPPSRSTGSGSGSIKNEYGSTTLLYILSADRHSCDANPDPDPNFHFYADRSRSGSGYVLALMRGTDPHADATHVDKSDDFFTFIQSSAN